MKLAAVQYRPPKGQPDQAREQLVSVARRAGQAGAALVVFPEMATTGYVWRSPEELLPHAEPAQGPTFQALSHVARRYGSWIVCGFAERSAGDALHNSALHNSALHNSALIIAPSGKLAACYRKVLLYEADLPWCSAGVERLALDTPELGRLVPGICMDLNDDGFVRHLRHSQAQVAAFCTNWTEEGIDVHAYWRWRLTGWRGWFVAGNTWGMDRGTAFCGDSAILGPGGRVLARADKTGDALLIVDTDGWEPVGRR